ncbi:MAG: DMT family transporter [Candidatus Eisenbacteria bacterium]|nr:DMT family transporter [Candidatus Eisenbacteria bacterium]
MTRRESLVADGALALTTVIWGTTFPLNKQILEILPPFGFMCLRFVLATVALALVARGSLARLDRRAWGAALLLSALLFLGFAFQLYGLRMTTPTKNAFLTSVSVPMVPFIGLWILRHRPGIASWIGCGLAFAGSLILTYQPGILIGPGDLLTLVCALCFAVQIVMMSKLMPGRSATAMTTAVCLCTALFSGAAWFVFREPRIDPAVVPWGAMLWLGVIANGIPLLVQSWAQKHTTAVHVAVIYALEPLFAALFSYLWLGDQMTPQAWVGGGVILAGVVVSEL